MTKRAPWPASLLFLVIASVSAQSAPGGLVVVVNKSNSVESLSMGQLRKLMLGDVRDWPDRKPVVVVARESSSKVSQTVLSSVVRLTEAECRRYIMNAEFRGEEPMAVQTADTVNRVGYPEVLGGRELVLLPEPGA